MLAVITAILSTIGSAISAVIKVVPWQAWACLAIFLFGGWVFYGGSCRDFACSRTRPPKPTRWEDISVSKATTGASLEHTYGIHGRRSKTISLAHIVAPSDGKIAEDSRASLEHLAGNLVRIPYKGLLIKDVQSQSSESATSDDSVNTESLESSIHPIVGTIYNQSGQCLNTEQVRLGMAKLAPDAPKDWKTFENEAKKNNLGVWKSEHHHLFNP
jgi:hypothetical protein